MSKNLTPIESYAFFELGLLSSTDLIELGVQWLESGQCTGSMCLLAGETISEMSTVQPLFLNTMKEIGLEKPSQIEAGQTVLKYYLRKIVSGDGDPVDLGNHIYTEVYHNIVPNYPDKEYVGDCIGIEHMCTWLREIWDAKDGSMLLYYDDLPREKAVIKFKEHLIEEANKLLKKLT
jgi:hypothetical protein